MTAELNVSSNSNVDLNSEDECLLGNPIINSEQQNFTQGELNNFVRNLILSKNSTQLLGSKTEIKEFSGSRNNFTWYGNEENEFTAFFPEENSKVYCKCIPELITQYLPLFMIHHRGNYPLILIREA